jgi:putative ABC transport system permease protein
LRRVDSDLNADVRADLRVVGPDFFKTMGIPIVRGRDFTDSDLRPADAVPVAVNEGFVRQYVGTSDPIGQRFVRASNPESGRPQQLLIIVSVSRDAMARTVGDGDVPVVYIPQLSRSLMIRLASGFKPAVAELRSQIAKLEPPGTAVTISPFGEEVAAALAPLRIAAILLGALAGMGLLLACAGLYAVVSYAATQRTFEIGVRMALGATRNGIAWMIVGDGLRIAAAGCLFGAATSWALGRLVQSAIAGQTVVAPTILATIAVLLAAIGVGASLGPAYRAIHADPVQALRDE